MRDTVRGTMWDNLYRVDWHSLMHAYGKARDMPQMLRDIVDADEDTCNDGCIGRSRSLATHPVWQFRQNSTLRSLPS